MQFDPANMVADVYDEEVRALVGAIVNTSAGASMLLVRGRTIRAFQKKLAQMTDEERKALVARYPPEENKHYDMHNWRGVWDRVLDNAYAMDRKGNHRARSMALSSEFLDIAEAVDARLPDAVPSAVVRYSRSLNDLKSRVKAASSDDDRNKYLEVIAKGFVTAFHELGSKRRITGSRSDAAVVDASIAALCEEGSLDVVTGVVAPPKAKGASKRDRETEDGNNKVGQDGKERKTTDPGGAAAVKVFEQMANKLGEERANGFIEWFGQEVDRLHSLFDDVVLTDVRMYSKREMDADVEGELCDD